MSPQVVCDLFKAALERPGWIDDKVPDQFTKTRSKNGSGVPPAASDNVVIRGANQRKKRALSKSLGVDLEQQPAKRQREDETCK